MRIIKKLLEPRLRIDHIAAAIGPRAFGVSAQELLHAGKDLAQHVRLRQVGDTKMRAIGYVETDARRDEHVFLLEKIEREALIVEAGQFARVGGDEGVHRSMR